MMRPYFCFIRHIKGAAEVDINDLLPTFVIHQGEECVTANSCIVDQDVNGVELFLYLMEERRDLTAVGNIALMELQPATKRLAFLQERFCCNSVAAINTNDLCP